MEAVATQVFDAGIFIFAFTFLLLLWIQASSHRGIGRWWRAKTPTFLL